MEKDEPFFSVERLEILDQIGHLAFSNRRLLPCICWWVPISLRTPLDGLRALLEGLHTLLERLNMSLYVIWSF